MIAYKKNIILLAILISLSSMIFEVATWIFFSTGPIWDSFVVVRVLIFKLCSRILLFLAIILLGGWIYSYLQHKKGEETIIETDQTLQTIIQASPLAIFVMDTDGKIQMWNLAAERMFGWKKEEVLGHVLPLGLSNNQKESERLLQKILTGNSLNNLELRGYKKDSSPIDISLFTAPLYGAQGLITGIIAMNSDITESKKLKEQLLQAQKMEAIGTLAGGIAHDFNNILTSIMGNISLAMLDQKDGPCQERLTEAEKACLRAQMMARQLLTFATGGAPVKELISIEKLATESASFASSGSNVKCEFNFPDNLWAVEADPSQINQVFQNLVINAMQAMPTGGKIEIWGENLVVEANSSLPLDAGKYVKISFQDQGIGIPKKYLSNIFDPYFTTKKAGNGLGLATAYSIIKNHQGHLGVESRLKRGTLFQIFLPAADQRMIEPPMDDRKVIKGQGKILVMDDDGGVRDMLRNMLQKLGYEAHCTDNGEEAIKVYMEALGVNKPFAAAILDLTVPGGMGGKIAIKELLKIDPQVKAIVSSGYSEDPIMAEFAKYGFSGVITKPYRVSEMSKLLKMLIVKE